MRMFAIAALFGLVAATTGAISAHAAQGNGSLVEDLLRMATEQGS